MNPGLQAGLAHQNFLSVFLLCSARLKKIWVFFRGLASYFASRPCRFRIWETLSWITGHVFEISQGYVLSLQSHKTPQLSAGFSNPQQWSSSQAASEFFPEPQINTISCTLYSHLSRVVSVSEFWWSIPVVLEFSGLFKLLTFYILSRVFMCSHGL